MTGLLLFECVCVSSPIPSPTGNGMQLIFLLSHSCVLFLTHSLSHTHKHTWGTLLCLTTKLRCNTIWFNCLFWVALPPPCHISPQSGGVISEGFCMRLPPIFSLFYTWKQKTPAGAGFFFCFFLRPAKAASMRTLPLRSNKRLTYSRAKVVRTHLTNDLKLWGTISGVFRGAAAVRA